MPKMSHDLVCPICKVMHCIASSANTVLAELQIALLRRVCIHRVNMGTSDELALDMVINALSNFSKE